MNCDRCGVLFATVLSLIAIMCFIGVGLIGVIEDRNNLIETLKTSKQVEKSSPCNPACTAKVCSLSYGDKVTSRMFPGVSNGLITQIGQNNYIEVSWCANNESKHIIKGGYSACEWKHVE